MYQDFDLGPQKQPSSSAKIKAETAQAVSQLEEIVKPLYFFSVERDDSGRTNREFLYSSIFKSIDTPMVNSEKFHKNTWEMFDKDPEKCIIMYQMPEDKIVLVIAKSRDELRCFIAGMKYEIEKDGIWDQMFDDWIDKKLQI